ncbi:hypothetical protein LUX12_21465 [Streptomyces somaliensis]|uniref:hypothetical protein n=1 Tax=Streptomyces somaliensis TaxID=78355 RepID=UPI0020CC817E|nr:hypothetical protein [Streptomyces somaliensis]MCP9946781.1 hypothetical protein [Streptomyces somaliensis]
MSSSRQNRPTSHLRSLTRLQHFRQFNNAEDQVSRSDYGGHTAASFSARLPTWASRSKDDQSHDWWMIFSRYAARLRNTRRVCVSLHRREMASDGLATGVGETTIAHREPTPMDRQLSLDKRGTGSPISPV